MTGREKAAAATAAVLAVGITGYSAWQILVTGVLSWHVKQPEFRAMMLELLVVWFLLVLSFCFLRKMFPAARTGIFLGIVILGYCWLHEIFLPVMFAGCYVGYLALVGMWFGRTFLRKRWDLCWNVLIGSAGTITMFCLLSLIQMGSIRKLRLWVLASGALLMIWRIRVWQQERLQGRWQKRQQECGSARDHNPVSAAMLAAIITLVLLQAGRMNLAVDFDSIWYGVRSDVMLDSGNGIYENLGTLGVVYTYSKGLETLTLPLAGLPSYSFVIAVNLWMGGLVLLASYRSAKIVLNKQDALWVPFLMAAIPGIMNMADTAKADLMTLFCQILMLQGMMWFIKEQRADWLVAAMAAGGLSLTLKPTAVVFSTAIVGMSMLWMIRELIREKKPQCLKIRNSRIWLMLIPSAAALIGIWGRTIRLVGVPVTSVFYQVFQKLGFQVKYPFYASGFPSAGGGPSLGNQLAFLAKRLYGICLNPQGDDMAHVIIAWGTHLPVVMLLLWLIFPVARAEGKEKRSERLPILSYCMWLIVPIGIVNLISLYSLSQIDGNYYMLYYALVILAGVIWLGSRKAEIRKICQAALIPVWLFAVVLCGLTNWAWALGNGGIRPINRGYYAHEEMERQKRADQGSQAIWDILASDPKNRVIALGEHPGVLTFPCWVQSYVDVSGYWGNPEVVASVPNFLEYLQFADVDYIYMEKEYVDTSVRIYQIVRTLVEQGWLYDVRDENGNLILTVNKMEHRQSGADRQQSVTEAEITQNLQVFDERYIQHP